jgi:hypothetical protein
MEGSLNQIINAETNHHAVNPSKLRVASLLVIFVCAYGSGCEDVATVWQAEARSPDGVWVAVAKTRQHGGPGTAGVETGVELERANHTGGKQIVLGFFHNPNNTDPRMLLKMTWLSPTHLQVEYGNQATLTFEVVKYQGVDISAKPL